MNIADIRGGKPTSISDKENDGLNEEQNLNEGKIDGEELPLDPDAPKPLHPEEIELEEEQKKLEEEGKKADETKDKTPELTPAPETIDYKEKFKASAREAQILSSKIKETEALIGKLTSENLPSEEELAQIVPDYEIMTDTERYLAKRQIAFENDTRRINLNAERARLENEYKVSLDTMLSADSRLKGKEEEFKEFISKPSRQGVDPEVLVSAFLFDLKDIPSDPKPKVRPGLTKGVGGSSFDSPELNKSGYSDTQIAHMRKYDQKKYMELIRTGKI